jgi:integrative and conjugative element protein (TIGR02256 family)
MPRTRRWQRSTSLPHNEPARHVLVVSHRAAALLEGYARASYPEETGGILIGHRDEMHITVTHVVGPGPRATHKRNRFWRDGQHAKRELDRIYTKTGGVADYIGEWHSHPISGLPSRIDQATMRRISQDSAYATTMPVLVVVQRDPRTEVWGLSAFVCNSRRLSPVTVQPPCS